MRTSGCTFAAVALAALILAGCASVPREAGFNDVERSVAERTGVKQVRWNQGGAADAEVAKEVASLLDSELTLDSAVQIALLNNRNLQATYEELAIAQADLVQAGLLQNPIFEAGFRGFAVPAVAQAPRDRVIRRGKTAGDQ
jgi:cobalt-zinc-cadmium efflux system outer membrane protein